MPNIGNTQQQIAYGASANDGTGDPLRTAFIKTDENFDNVWLAGPVGSNITIINNTIGVNNTNGNLILSPNGVGNVQFNRDAVPRLNNTYNLGAANLRWRSVSVGTGGIDITGNLVLGNIANLRIPGGTNGYVIQTDGTGNLTWTVLTGPGNSTIGGANTQVQFNDAGTFGGQPGFTFNKSSNVLSVPGNVTSSGNISTTGSASAAGNITGGNLISSSLVSGATASISGNITIGNVLTSGLLSAAGNITGNNITSSRMIVTTPVSLANLTAIAGARAFISNANLTAVGNFGNQVGSGGSNVVPVWSNGTNWYIG